MNMLSMPGSRDSWTRGCAGRCLSAAIAHEFARLINSSFEIIIDDKGVIQLDLGGLTNFMLGFCKSSFDGILVIASTGLKSSHQFIFTRGEDEDHERGWHGVSDLTCTLDIDVEDDQFTLLQGSFHRTPWGPIGMSTKDLGPFEKLATPLHSVEFTAGHEVVVLTIHFLGGSRTGGRGHAESATQSLLHAMDNGGLAHPGRP